MNKKNHDGGSSSFWGACKVTVDKTSPAMPTTYNTENMGKQKKRLEN